MTTTLSSAAIPPGEREEFIREAVWNSIVKADIDFQRNAPLDEVDFDAAYSSFGKLIVFSAQASSAQFHRTARMARDDVEPMIFVGLQTSGTGLVIQDGREAVLHAGEFAIYDSTAPYSLVFPGRIDNQVFRIPRSALALPETAFRELTAVPMGSDDPLTGFVASYFSRLAEGYDLRESIQSTSVAEPTVELLRAALSSKLLESKHSRSALEATLEVRILDYMTRHLAEPDLTTKRIAFAHHISVRYLYVILARGGISPSDWIRHHRLEACRHDLSMAGARSETISAVASRWGFNDGATFSRLFKSVYGLAPRDWREISGVTKERIGGHAAEDELGLNPLLRFGGSDP